MLNIPEEFSKIESFSHRPEKKPKTKRQVDIKWGEEDRVCFRQIWEKLSKDNTLRSYIEACDDLDLKLKVLM